MTGAKSSYANGRLIRDFFKKSGNFLSTNYNSDEVYV